MAALELFQREIDAMVADGREVIASEASGTMTIGGITVRGRADRIDRLADKSLAIVDYKTGPAPEPKQVASGYALQLGLLGLIARDGGFATDDGILSGEASRFEYWSLAKKDKEFGSVDQPMKTGNRKVGLEPAEFLPRHEDYLETAISTYLLGNAPFTAKENPDYPGYSDYDQLMRLQEWIVTQSQPFGDADDKA